MDHKYALEAILFASGDPVSIDRLADVLEMPAQNIYLVKGEREIMIPAVEEFILNTDVKNKVITVHLIEGM